MVTLLRVPRGHSKLLADMADHYSQPGGFVGRTLCYLILGDNWKYHGAIVAGSATRHLPGRELWLSQNKLNPELEEIVNNVFFHVVGPYPKRNFTTAVVAVWRERVKRDWLKQYGDKVLAFETLVELPRTGELYRRDGFTEIGITKGFTCKRTGGNGTDFWGGKRVWNTTELRPKRVMMRTA